MGSPSPAGTTTSNPLRRPRRWEDSNGASEHLLISLETKEWVSQAHQKTWGLASVERWSCSRGASCVVEYAIYVDIYNSTHWTH